jgi:hypothetical protein
MGTSHQRLSIILKQHHQILEQVFDNIHMDPDTLLPRHWHLLEINPATLGGSSTAN